MTRLLPVEELPSEDLGQELEVGPPLPPLPEVDGMSFPLPIGVSLVPMGGGVDIGGGRGPLHSLGLGEGFLQPLLELH